jgi:hypothetical protein
MTLHKRYTNKFIPLFVLAPFVLGAGVVSAVTTVTSPPLDYASSVMQKIYRPQSFAGVVVVNKAEGSMSTSIIRDLYVTLGGVKDSRCPLGANCIWAGEVTTMLAIQDKTEKESVVFVDVRVNGEPVRYGKWNVSISLREGPSSMKGSRTPYLFLIKFNKIKNNTPPPALVAMGRVEGTVLAGPTCPVEHVDQPCPDKPIATTLALYNAAQGVFIKTIESAQDGTFSDVLPEGSYHLERYEAPNVPALPRISPVEFTVTGGQTAKVVVHADTGIR